MICIQVSATSEWDAVKEAAPGNPKKIEESAWIEYFDTEIEAITCRFYKGGSTKTRSAASCQHAIDRWKPKAIIVIGTCGGVDHGLKTFDIILANRTGQYDVIDRIGEKKPLFYECYNVEIDNSLLKPETHRNLFTQGFIATADQDVIYEQMTLLQPEGVAGADWESGAITAICMLNKTPCYVLRGISDIPSLNSTQEPDFIKNTPIVMRNIVQNVLPTVVPIINANAENRYNLTLSKKKVVPKPINATQNGKLGKNR